MQKAKNANDIFENIDELMAVQRVDWGIVSSIRVRLLWVFYKVCESSRTLYYLKYWLQLKFE